MSCRVSWDDNPSFTHDAAHAGMGLPAYVLNDR